MDDCFPEEWTVLRRWLPDDLEAMAKSCTATLRAQKRQRAKASRMGRQLDSRSVALAEYVLVLTSLPTKRWPTARVLQLYRCRWQVELVFKRLKSLLGLGHLPKTNDQSARAWMQAKILTALLIERAMYEARFFSPWGYALECQPVASVPRNG
jgi:IS4 transposase